MGDIADYYLESIDFCYSDYNDYECTIVRYYGYGPCPRCGSKMHVVNGPHGAFYGCDKYPKCKGIRYINKKAMEKR
jgi:ssDNA-binding Zn-finger/Zn-ribbon topoisomerase 1